MNQKFINFIKLKPHWLVVLFSLFLSQANAQVSTYTFAQSLGTYVPITGGTVINSTIPDSWQSSAITLSSPFYFAGNFYSSAYITSNGLISLGGTAGPGTTQYNGIANNGAGSGIHIAPFNGDQVGSTRAGAVPEMRYEFINNEHVFQWKDISRYSSTTDLLSYQARLNVITGTITFVYKIDFVGTSTSYQPIVGIRTANTAGNWQNRLVADNATSSWAASELGTATTSACRFTSTTSNPKQPVTGQTYVYSPATPPPNCANSLTMPTAGTVSVTPGNVCVSGNVTINFTPATPMPVVGGVSYKWQVASVLAGPYIDIPGAVTMVPTYTTTTPITANSYFRCVVLCNSTSTVLTSSPSSQVVVTNPGTPTGIPASRCGPGVVALGATPPAGSSINWYANATGGAPLVTGSNNFTTPYLPTTTTFYAAAASGSTPATPQIGTATTVTPDYYVGGPFSNYYRAVGTQMLYTANEIITAGGGAGTINTIAFNCTSIPIQNLGTTPTAFPNYKISIYTVPTTVNVLTWQPTASFTPVYQTASFLPTLGWNTLNLTTPFVWDGASNVIIYICYDQSQTTYSSGTTGKHEYTNISDRMLSYYSDAVTTSCDVSGTATSTYLPNVRFGMTLGCTGARVPVVATINPSTPVPRTSPAVVCNNGVATMALTPPAAPNNYPSYNWSPQTELFTNAAATIPYTGGSATTVYMKSPVVGVHTYYMMAGNPNITTGCTYADTVKIHVQPGNILIKGQPDTLCAPAGSSTLKLDTIAGYYAGSIQWQSSTDGINYSNIAGANSSTFITPSLTFGNNTYYKAVITAGSTVCETPVKYMVIANPTLTGTTDSFNCGPGTVTLKATTGGNGAARWYDVPTLGIPLGSGSEFVTPFLTQTDTFYVESAAGGSSLPPTFVGSGTLTSPSYWSPYYDYYYGHKAQYLIRASELLALGFDAGNILSVGFDVLGVTSNYPLTGYYLSMKHTTATTLNTVWETGLTPVFGPVTYQPIANSVNVHTLNTPFPWDGTSNIVIEVCHNNTGYNTSGPAVTVRYTSLGFNGSHYVYADNATNCTAPGTGTASVNRPNIRLDISGGCKSPRQPVIAYIHPFPTVNLGGNINQCVDPGSAIVLDAGLQQYSPSFVWDNGPGQQVRAVNTSGNYYVTATNLYGCASSDTVQVTLRHNPVVELGNDTSVCNGVVLPLNAGTDGISYFWNTGATTSTINVNSPGTYNVFVTNAEGCTKTDTITVTMQGQLPSHNGIQITNNGVDTFHFSAMNPQNVIGYEWDFGDNSPFAYSQNPKHKYLNSGNYIVTLKLSSTCGEIVDTTTVHILGLGVDDVNAKIQLALYPNPTSDKLTIEAKNNVLLEGIQVYNILGQLMQTEVVHQSKKHELSLSGLANGMYTIKVQTDKGSVTRKIDLVR